MRMKDLSNDIIIEIESAYLAGETLQDIALVYNLSVNMVKRILAERMLLNLSWHKTKEEHSMLEHLYNNNIFFLQELKERV